MKIGGRVTRVNRPAKPPKKRGRVKQAAPGGAKRTPNSDDIPRCLENEVVVLLATGPSLTKEQIELLRPLHEKGKLKIVGCNDSYRLCDFLDVLYFCDGGWFKHNPDVLDYNVDFVWTQDSKAKGNHPTRIKKVSGSSGNGISTRPHHIHWGSNSGFQLINLAYHMGAQYFILLGYNMDVPKGMQQHFFGKHPKGLNQGNSYKGFCSAYEKIQPDIKNRIINATQPSALKAFRNIKLEDALEELLGETERRSREVNEEAAEKPTPRGTHPTYIYGMYGGVSGDGAQPHV